MAYRPKKRKPRKKQSKRKPNSAESARFAYGEGGLKLHQQQREARAKQDAKNRRDKETAAFKDAIKDAALGKKKKKKKKK